MGPQLPTLFAMLVTKDDADVLPESLANALTFCDRVVVMDNCSTDGTWEFLNEQAAAQPDRILLHRQFDEPFYDGIRSELHNKLYRELGDGWWMMFAADEFMTTDPRRMLVEAQNAGCDAVFAWMAQFMFTNRDLKKWEAGEEDESQSIRARRQYYRTDWREFRFIRNDPKTPWTDDSLYMPRPVEKYTVHDEMMLLEHYQFRTPEQMERRIEARVGRFGHVTSADWKDYVQPAWRYQRQRPGAPVRVVPAWYYAKRVPQRLARLVGRRKKSGWVLKES